MSDLDEIELSFHSYNDGMPEALPVVPRLTLSMKKEKEIWKLGEISVTLRVPLGDEEYLKGLQKRQSKDSESSAVASLRTLNTAEISYAASFPQNGYTCKLSQLGGSNAGGEPSPDHAMLIDDVLADGRKSGYTFAVQGCDVPPASKYQVTAVPTDPESASRSFCSDQTAVVRYASDGKAATCLSDGVPLQQ
jgi:type IV pilus assembly protein PilA